MGTILDTSVFIDLERATRGLSHPEAMGRVGDRLSEQLGEGDEVAIASITASELLHGVHRADPSNRARREAFVEGVLDVFPVIPFDLRKARVHAMLWSGLAAAGTEVGAHDRLVAATALASGWRIGSANTRHFARVPGLDVVAIRLA